MAPFSKKMGKKGKIIEMPNLTVGGPRASTLLKAAALREMSMRLTEGTSSTRNTSSSITWVKSARSPVFTLNLGPATLSASTSPSTTP